MITRICPIIKSKTGIEYDFETFSKVINSGFNAIRINFSHISKNMASDYLKYIRQNHPGVKIIQDLQGHKIRIGNVETITINKDENFIIGPEEYKYSGNLKYIPLKFECYDLLADTKYFIVENKNSLTKFYVKTRMNEKGTILFHCQSDSNAILRKEKGINAIGFKREKLQLSNKDKTDLMWGIENKADIIIYSFASSAEQIIEMKEYIKSKSPYMPKIWAKIESIEGVKNLSEILRVVDGIMIGRGDMCVEFSIEDVPMIQDKIIQECKTANKECIVATHIFENFQNNYDISDISALFYLFKNGATGFMPVNEMIFAKDPVYISTKFNRYINKLEKKKIR